MKLKLSDYENWKSKFDVKLASNGDVKIYDIVPIINGDYASVRHVWTIVKVNGDTFVCAGVKFGHTIGYVYSNKSWSRKFSLKIQSNL